VPGIVPEGPAGFTFTFTVLVIVSVLVTVSVRVSVLTVVLELSPDVPIATPTKNSAAPTAMATQ
jgi:hypothetical protein